MSSMEYSINLYFVRSLKHIALIKTAVILWNEQDIRDLLTPCYSLQLQSADQEHTFSEMHLKVREKVNDLQVPLPLKEDILLFVKQIGKQLFHWARNHSSKYYPGIYLPSELSWTSYGAINERETVKKLTEDGNLHILTRYKLACTYCLEDDIPELWNQMPPDCRGFWSNTDEMAFCDEFREMPFLAVWTHAMGGQVEEVYLNRMIEDLNGGNINAIAFDFAALAYNKPATEFFLRKITDEEKNSILVETTRTVACNFVDDKPRIDVLCYLVSQIDMDQHMDAFKLITFDILRCFLDRCYKDICLEATHRLWDFLPETGYVKLLESIANEILLHHDTDSYYGGLFSKFWDMGSVAYKKHAVNESSNLFTRLFQHPNLKYIHMILNDVTATERKNLIFSTQGILVCSLLFGRRERDRLRFFLKECLSNDADFLEFQAKAKVYAFGDGLYLSREWPGLFRFLKDYFSTFKSEKEAQGDVGTSSKKPRMGDV